jgi:uncharacterized delta-60 repeat protein
LTAALVAADPSIAEASPGDLDPSFDGDGVAQIDVGRLPAGEAAAIQADGKIVVAGSNSGSKFVLVRFLPDGATDTGFGEAGAVVTRVGDYSAASDVALQTNGKIVVGGTSYSGRRSRFALARYVPDGSLDPRFGEGGKVTTLFAATAAIGAIAIQPDGMIVAAGYRGHDIAVVRYTRGGRLDPTFSRNGRTSLTVGNRAEATGIAVQPDGKLAVVGSTFRRLGGGAYDTDFVIAQLLPHGRPDPTYGSGGPVALDLSAPDEGATDVATRADGSILVAGGSGNVKPGANVGFSTLIRVLSDGTLDPTFSGDGWLKADFGATWASAHAVTIADDGTIIVVGQAQLDTIGNVFVARYASDGTRDTTFGTHGRVITPFGRAADDVAMQADGNIVITARTSPSLFTVARFLGA